MNKNTFTTEKLGKGEMNVYDFGTLKLMPPEYRLNALAADYNAMKDMLYGDIPSFDSVMYGIKVLEQQIDEL